MSTEAKAILWIGFILIIFQIVKAWSTVKATLFSPGPGNSSSGLAPGIPNFPLIPVPTFAKTNSKKSTGIPTGTQ